VPVRADAPADHLPVVICDDGANIRQPGRTEPLVNGDSHTRPLVGMAGWLPGVLVVARPSGLEIVEDNVVRYRWSVVPAGDRITAIGLSQDRTQVAVATRRGGILVLDLGRLWRERPPPGGQ
jgi:hypothetical protein